MNSENRPRLYRFRDLKTAGVPFTRKHVVDLEKRGEFPHRVNLTASTVCWVAAEIDNWVEERIRARRRRMSDESLTDVARPDGPTVDEAA